MKTTADVALSLQDLQKIFRIRVLSLSKDHAHYRFDFHGFKDDALRRAGCSQNELDLHKVLNHIADCPGC
jgi:hypothetical protein